MNNFTFKDIMLVFQKCFNYIDTRLDRHCEQVAFLYWKTLQHTGKYTEEELVNLTLIALFHDIGTYKKKDFSEFLYNTSPNPHLHSICGSLFIKYFSPLSHLSDIILHHHDSIIEYEKLDFPYKDETILLNLLDKISLFIHRKSYITDEALKKILHSPLNSSLLDYFKEVNQSEELISKVIDGRYLKELYHFLNHFEPSKETTMEYVRMMMYMIDFRSESTLIHTITVTSLSKIIAIKLGLDDEVVTNLAFAATMHDIGKIATPIEILEKPTKLTSSEMEIMKQHVTITYDILNCICSKDIVEMAAYHHEKLDGSGYPFGLKDHQLSIPVRIISIADIMSALLGVRSYKQEFPKEKIINILENLARDYKIDSDIVEFIVTHYDTLVYELSIDSKPYLDRYTDLKKEYQALFKQKIAC